MTQTSKTNARTAADARRKTLFARTTTAALIPALVSLEKLEMNQERRIARAWMIEELERRFPAASEIVEQTFAEADAAEQATGEPVEVDYVAVLIAAIRSTTKS